MGFVCDFADSIYPPEWREKTMSVISKSRILESCEVG